MSRLQKVLLLRKSWRETPTAPFSQKLFPWYVASFVILNYPFQTLPAQEHLLCAP